MILVNGNGKVTEKMAWEYVIVNAYNRLFVEEVINRSMTECLHVEIQGYADHEESVTVGWYCRTKRACEELLHQVNGALIAKRILEGY